MRAQWHLQTMHISALPQFSVEGRGEDNLDLDLHFHYMVLKLLVFHLNKNILPGLKRVSKTFL